MNCYSGKTGGDLGEWRGQEATDSFADVWTSATTCPSDTTARDTATAARNGSDASWHSRQSWIWTVPSEICPWCGMWLMHSEHLLLAGASSWTCKDDNISIGRNTDNNSHADMRLLVLIFIIDCKSTKNHLYNMKSNKIFLYFSLSSFPFERYYQFLDDNNRYF